MLNNEQLELLQWIQEQPNEVSMNTMEKLSAPNFTPARVEVLHKGNYIERNIGVENGELVSVYSISDKGRAALQNQNSISREKPTSFSLSRQHGARISKVFRRFQKGYSKFDLH